MSFLETHLAAAKLSGALESATHPTLLFSSVGARAQGNVAQSRDRKGAIGESAGSAPP